MSIAISMTFRIVATRSSRGRHAPYSTIHTIPVVTPVVKQSTQPSWTKTTYSICYSAPKVQKILRKTPKLTTIVQLRGVTISARPMPAFDLTSIAAVKTWVSREIWKHVRHKFELHSDDFALIRTHDCRQKDIAAAGNTSAYEVPAIIGRPRISGKVDSIGRVLLNDGSE